MNVCMHLGEHAAILHQETGQHRQLHWMHCQHLKRSAAASSLCCLCREWLLLGRNARLSWSGLVAPASIWITVIITALRLVACLSNDYMIINIS